MKTLLITPLIVLILCTGCQTAPEAQVLPTLVTLPEDVPSFAPTRAVRELPTRAPTVTFAFESPTQTPPMLNTTPVQTIIPLNVIETVIETVTPIWSPTPRILGMLPDETFSFGQSSFGRVLTGYRIGTGDQIILLVGGIHGGWETNTVDLMREIIDYYQLNPATLDPALSLVVIPALNPDGIAKGRTLEGRFNDRRVDLNRNWGCGWQAEAYFRNQIVSAGEQPFSEPETAALSQLILTLNPAVVLFYHSAADGVFIGRCAGDDAGSDAMATIYGEATGYSYGASFSAYPVTGTAPSWVVSLGIPSADVELASSNSSEFDRNLRGLTALQCWVLQCDGS